jgi:hypothetical protein
MPEPLQAQVRRWRSATQAFHDGDQVIVARLADDLTARELLGLIGTVVDCELLGASQWYYQVRLDYDGRIHYLNEQMLESAVAHDSRGLRQRRRRRRAGGERPGPTDTPTPTIQRNFASLDARFLPSDDYDRELSQCLYYRGLPTIGSVVHVIAYVEGHVGDGTNWHWVVELNDGQFMYVAGWRGDDGWEHGAANGWFGDNAFSAIAADPCASALGAAGRLLIQVSDYYLSAVRTRIDTSIIRDGPRRHTVIASGVAWKCRNCDFKVPNDEHGQRQAREHSEKYVTVYPAKRAIRKPRRPI